MAKLSQIEGIGKKYARKLEKVGIESLEALLQEGCKKKGRKDLAKSTGISEKLILKWVNRADLARIQGIGTQYADLLEASGVDTVPELAKRKPENLEQKMLEVNKKKKLVRRPPGLARLNSWKDQAKKLPRVIKH
jgi:predicted flap endonuclease-1-like 5' DNA nuclease